jgi:hypothetical protein
MLIVWGDKAAGNALAPPTAPICRIPVCEMRGCETVSFVVDAYKVPRVRVNELMLEGMLTTALDTFPPALTYRTPAAFVDKK